MMLRMEAALRGSRWRARNDARRHRLAGLDISLDDFVQNFPGTRRHELEPLKQWYQEAFAVRAARAC